MALARHVRQIAAVRCNRTQKAAGTSLAYYLYYIVYIFYRIRYMRKMQQKLQYSMFIKK